MKKLIAWSVCFILGGNLLAEGGKDAADTKTAPANAAAAAGAQLVLELSDGSRIVGTTAIDRLKISTQYSDMAIPLARLRALELAPDRAAQVSFQNGDHVNGRLATAEIAMKTAYGQFVIPMAHVRKIRMGRFGGDMPEGLVLHYSFDTNEGAKVTDSSDCGNDGKAQGATYTSEGKIGGAMSFSGDGDAVIVGNPASLRLQDFTIMAWIKRGSAEAVSKTTEYGEIFGYGSGGYVLGIHQEGYIYLSQADVHIGAVSGFQIHDKNFHHVVVTKQGTNFVFYLDGVADAAQEYQTEGDFVFNTDAAVGARSDDLHKCFLGMIDELAVFKRALSAEEVKKVYESQK